MLARCHAASVSARYRGVMPASLFDLAASYDAQDFVGRSAELGILERLVTSPEGQIVFVHGPGGIGKSALLREAERRARREGRPVISIDLRDATPSPQSLAGVRSAIGLDRPMIVLDTFEHVAALSQHLRDILLPELPAETLVLIASREAPGAAWHATAWARITTDIPLGPLAVFDATTLLNRHGLVEPDAVQRVLSWSGGNPLGLVLAAERPDRAADTETMLPPDALAAELIQRLLDTDVDASTMRTQALALASIVRVTTPELLRSIFRESAAADDVWSWLRLRSFLTPTGAGIAPHELLARALRAQVRAGSPALERRLRRAAVDALAADAWAGGTTAIADLIHLVDTPAIRWGFGVNASTHHLDRLRPRDVPVIRAATDTRIGPYLPLLIPWFEHEPESFYVIRSVEQGIAGVGLAFNARTASKRALADPFVGPRLAHARENFDGDVVVWHSQVTFDEDPIGAVQGLIGIGGYEYTGASNPVASYLIITPSRPSATAFAAAVGAVAAPSLDVVLPNGTPMQVHIIDHGPSGLVGSIRRNVYRELGLDSDALDAVADAGPAVSVEQLRTALRALDSDRGLAACELAVLLLPAGGTVVSRAAEVRRVLHESIERAWPVPSCDERIALTQTYPLASSLPARDLHLSRASWFRLLRRALEGVVDRLNSRAGIGGVSGLSQLD
jgi:hypothetical protein